jgi:hypothetical protein
MSLVKIGRVEKETLSSSIVFTIYLILPHKNPINYTRLDIDVLLSDREPFTRTSSQGKSLRFNEYNSHTHTHSLHDGWHWLANELGGY